MKTQGEGGNTMASVGRPPKGKAKRVDTFEITQPTNVGPSKISNAITGPKEVADTTPIGNTITKMKEE
jgi:hypothetical protein